MPLLFPNSTSSSDMRDNSSITSQNIQLSSSQLSSSAMSISISTKYTSGLISVMEVPYDPCSNWNLRFFDYLISVIKLLKKSEQNPIKYNIDASFSQTRYFVIPNVKGLCNRLQLFAGLYILSSYYHIPIILSSSMEWSRYWNLNESFPGQFIELPDRGMINSILYYIEINLINLINLIYIFIM